MMNSTDLEEVFPKFYETNGIEVLEYPLSYSKKERQVRQTWRTDTSVKPQWRTVFLVAKTRLQNLLKMDDNGTFVTR